MSLTYVLGPDNLLSDERSSKFFGSYVLFLLLKTFPRMYVVWYVQGYCFCLCVNGRGDPFWRLFIAPEACVCVSKLPFNFCLLFEFLHHISPTNKGSQSLASKGQPLFFFINHTHEEEPSHSLVVFCVTSCLKQFAFLSTALACLAN